MVSACLLWGKKLIQFRPRQDLLSFNLVFQKPSYSELNEQVVEVF